MLWRQENAMQQQIASIREEVNKKEQALRSITGKVRVASAKTRKLAFLRA